MVRSVNVYAYRSRSQSPNRCSPLRAEKMFSLVLKTAQVEIENMKLYGRIERERVKAQKTNKVKGKLNKAERATERI